MTPARYDMRCPVARTLAMIGDRWTILILRDLLLEGPRKFQDFERSLAGISPTTLSARIKQRERRALVPDTGALSRGGRGSSACGRG